MNRKNMKKMMSVIVSLIMIFSLCLNTRHTFAVDDDLNVQTDGEMYNWDADTGTLTITGNTGDYTSSSIANAPYVQVAGGQNNIKRIIVNGDSQTTIGSNAFSRFTKLESVEINTCGDIKDYAFNLCSQLKTVTINNCGNIGNRAFGQCSQLETFTVTNSCGDFDEYVFQNALRLKTFQVHNAGDIGNIEKNTNVFSQANKIESFIVDGKCGNIGHSLLSNKSTLTTLQINQCDNIGKNAFSGCTSLTGAITLNCGNIGTAIFKSCSNIESLTIEKCGHIESSGFKGLTGLKKLHIKECNDIGSNAFGGMSFTPGEGVCQALEEVEINQCHSIGSQAFAQLKNLKNLKIENCNTIEEMAFWNSGVPIEKLELENCLIKDSAFYVSKIEEVILNQNVSIEAYAFNGATIHSLTLSGVKLLDDNTFAGVKDLQKLTISDVPRIEEGTFKVYEGNDNEVDYVGNYAFKGFTNLKHVYVDGTVQYVGAHAFTGCESLESIDLSDETRLGYSSAFVDQDYVHNRVINILKDQFVLFDMSQPIDTIQSDGWTSVQVGLHNSTDKIGDTQITKEAKWKDVDKTVAHVKMKAYYTANPQMDFIFVADCSNSMSGFGSSDAMNSNFYNMQSKMIDVVDKVLTDENLDTRVAFTTFGESESSQSRFYEKGEEEQAKEYIWNDIVNYYSNTNYSHGLEETYKLVQQNKDRNTTVIFISDGQPFYPDEVPEEYYGVNEAKAIQDKGVQIISVLQQVPESELESSIANMEKIANQIYFSTDLDGFSQAINDAIDYAYTSYTITDTIDPGFTLDQESIKFSAGNVVVGKNDSGLTTITWTISGHPFEELILTFDETLNADASGDYPEGNLETNEGYAIFNNGIEDVNKVASPILPRDDQRLYIDKQWINDNESLRPENIEVMVMRDGELYQTITLSKETNWSAVLIFDLADHMNDYTWTVEELNVPKGYTVHIEETDTGWRIVNTYKQPEIIVTPDKPEPIEPATPEMTKPTLPDNNDTVVMETKETTQRTQTSDSYQVVEYTVLAGMALLGILLVIKSQKRNKKI